MKVQIVVTHLLGSGHLVRAAVLARAFSAAGHTVQLVSGGFPLPHLDTATATFCQLPPLRSDGTNFTRLLTAEGTEASHTDLQARVAQLIACFDSFAPDVILTELFPFGRRVLRAEFLALLEHAKATAPNVLRLCSIRDVLAPPSKPKKAQWVGEVLEHHFDGVLVHSDRALIPLEKSWPVSPEIEAKLSYTGFVTAPLPDRSDATKGEVLVSAGGSNVGASVFQAALEAAGTDEKPWRLLVGGAQAAERIADFARLRSKAQLEPARKDFRAILQDAAAFVGLCGYNTAMDVLQTGVPAVFIPFDADGEQEQTIRAKALAQQPGIEVLSNADLAPDRLLQAVKAAMDAPPRTTDFDNDGANRSVTLTEKMMAARI